MTTDLVADELAAQQKRELESAAAEVRAALAELAAFSERRAEVEADLKAEARRLRARNELARSRYEAARKAVGPAEVADYATAAQSREN